MDFFFAVVSRRVPVIVEVRARVLRGGASPVQSRNGPYTLSPGLSGRRASQYASIVPCCRGQRLGFVFQLKVSICRGFAASREHWQNSFKFDS